MSESINDTETEYASVEKSTNDGFSEIRNIIRKMLLLHHGKEKKRFQF